MFKKESIVAVLVTLIAGPAAADLKRINGTMGVLENDSDIFAFDRGALRMGGVLGEFGVVYPLLRSNTTNTNGLSKLDVKLFKVNPTQFACFAESNDRNGNALKVVERSTTATGRVALSWGNALNVGISKGSYGVVCYPSGTVLYDFSDEVYAVDYDEPTPSGSDKSSPGSACQIDNDNNLDAGRGTGDFLTGETPFTAVCSLVRDNTTNTNGLLALQVRLMKNDGASQTCTARSHDAFGNLLKAVSRSVSGTGGKTLSWGTSLNVSGAGSYYSVTCSLNGGTAVSNLYWNEPSPSEPSGDAKIVHANECKTATHLPLLRNTNRVTATTGPGFENFTSTLLQCAPMRDTFKAASILTSLVVRGNGSGNCEGVIGDGHNNYLLSVSDGHDGPGSFTLDFGNTLNMSAINAQYGMECSLPAGGSGALYSFAWRE